MHFNSPTFIFLWLTKRICHFHDLDICIKEMVDIDWIVWASWPLWILEDWVDLMGLEHLDVQKTVCGTASFFPSPEISMYVQHIFYIMRVSEQRESAKWSCIYITFSNLPTPQITLVTFTHPFWYTSAGGRDNHQRCHLLIRRDNRSHVHSHTDPMSAG